MKAFVNLTQENRPLVPTCAHCANGGVSDVKIGFVSLGCPKNQVDLEVMMARLKDAGYEITGKAEQADIIVINTCGFITPAKEEAIDNILDMAEYKLRGSLKHLVVTGCLAQRYPYELLEEMPEIDGLMGVANPGRITEVIERVIKGERPVVLEEQSQVFDGYGRRLMLSGPGWAYLKIAEGCNNRCAYCAIPLIRGNLRSRSLASVLEEARELARLGIKELVLIAQDTTAYGSERREEWLSYLLKNLAELDELEWIRLLYAHPAHVSFKLWETMAGINKIVPYLDLPIQHCNDDVLKRMGRGYTKKQLENLIVGLRSAVPGITLRTTVMVGFPGEGEDEYAELVDFIKEQRFNWLGVFGYSPEEGTASSRWADEISEEIKQQRADGIRAVQAEITGKWLSSLIGTEQRVLVDRRWHGRTRGHAACQAPEIDGIVRIPRGTKASPGQFCNVRITGVKGIDLIGEIIDEPTE